MSTTAELEQFIIAELAKGREIVAIAPDEDLLARGIVDSHGIMEIVAFLEQRYGFMVGDEDLTPENFRTLSAIGAFVDGRGR